MNKIFSVNFVKGMVTSNEQGCLNRIQLVHCWFSLDFMFKLIIFTWFLVFSLTIVFYLYNWLEMCRFFIVFSSSINKMLVQNCSKVRYTGGQWKPLRAVWWLSSLLGLGCHSGLCDICAAFLILCVLFFIHH